MLSVQGFQTGRHAFGPSQKQLCRLSFLSTNPHFSNFPKISKEKTASILEGVKPSVLQEVFRRAPRDPGQTSEALSGLQAGFWRAQGPTQGVFGGAVGFEVRGFWVRVQSLDPKL